jgi:hypothetical protein
MPTSAERDATTRGLTVAPTIGASAILAYLFIPFTQGTKPPTAVVARVFATSLTTVVVSEAVYARLCKARFD